MRSKVVLLVLLVFFVGFASAIPQTFSIHGKLSNESGAMNGTYQMNFSLYDVYTGGSYLWNDVYSVTTDGDGVYDVILKDIDLPFSAQYYLGINVEGDGEMVPRVNLTSSGYAFRANVSDHLVAGNNYEMGNLTLGQRISFAFGEMIDNIVDGWVRVTGGLNVTGNVEVGGDLVVEGYVYSAQCPDDMAYIDSVGGYCIDKWEASMPSANSTDMGNAEEVALRNAPGTMAAVSQSGVVPWVRVSQVSAGTACENAGKRLCSGEEWLGAANLHGQTYYLPSSLSVAPYGCVVDSSTYCLDHSYESGEACNTGYNDDGASGCYSEEGVYDMVGNVWEWTDEVVDVISPDEVAGWKYINTMDLSWSTSSSVDDGKYGKDGVYFPVTTSGRAVPRGGDWDYGADAGPFCADLYYAPTITYYAIGFRCCSS